MLMRQEGGHCVPLEGLSWYCGKDDHICNQMLVGHMKKINMKQHIFENNKIPKTTQTRLAIFKCR